MLKHSTIHGSFTIQREYTAPAARVFAAWSDIAAKARWFIGPPDTWKLLERELDFRVGGKELVRGQFSSGRVSQFSARYHAIVPNERLVFAYDMHIDDGHLSTSLATVEFDTVNTGRTRMTFTEQAAFFDGNDGTESRETGTAAHFDKLGPVLDDPHEIVSARVLDAPRAVVFRAFSDPEQLAHWWGPKGFTNTFQEFDLRPGGTWRFAMRGPDGADYPMLKNFVEVRQPERVVLKHPSPTHGFQMDMIYADLGEQALLTWRMRFDSSDEATAVRERVVEANEQNFDRLAAHLGTLGRARRDELGTHA